MHHIVKELKQRTAYHKTQQQNIIEFDNYFKYSGKEEKVNLKIAYLIEKEKRHRLKFAWGIKNDMSKYKLKKNEK